MPERIENRMLIDSDGKTWETLTANEVGQMLRTINDKYGD